MLLIKWVILTLIFSTSQDPTSQESVLKFFEGLPSDGWLLTKLPQEIQPWRRFTDDIMRRTFVTFLALAACNQPFDFTEKVCILLRNTDDTSVDIAATRTGYGRDIDHPIGPLFGFHSAS